MYTCLTPPSLYSVKSWLRLCSVFAGFFCFNLSFGWLGRVVRSFLFINRSAGNRPQWRGDALFCSSMEPDMDPSHCQLLSLRVAWECEPLFQLAVWLCRVRAWRQMLEIVLHCKLLPFFDIEAQAIVAHHSVWNTMPGEDGFCVCYDRGWRWVC